MMLVIEHNPHSDEPEKLFEQLKMETGTSYIDEVEPDHEAIKGLQALISPHMQK